MIKGFVIRIYPTTEQKKKFFAHIGCSRYIWNYMLELQNNRYSKGLKHLSAYDMMNLLTPLKNDGEHDWLYDVSATSIKNVCQDLAEAYKKFFSEKCGYPKFKAKKKAKPAYAVRSDHFYFTDEQYVNIEKVGKVKYKTDFSFPAGRNAVKYSNVRVTYNPLKDRWYISFGIDCENQATVLTDKPLGIDLGIKNLAIAAYDALRSALSEHSPSRKAKKSGKNFDLGFKLGIEENAKTAISAAEELSKNTLDAINLDEISEKVRNLDIPKTMARIQMAVEDRNETVAKKVTASVAAYERLKAGGDSSTPVTKEDMCSLLSDISRLTVNEIAETIGGMGVYMEGKPVGKLVASTVNMELGRINRRKT